MSNPVRLTLFCTCSFLFMRLPARVLSCLCVCLCACLHVFLVVYALLLCVVSVRYSAFDLESEILCR